MGVGVTKTVFHEVLITGVVCCDTVVGMGTVIVCATLEALEALEAFLRNLCLWLAVLFFILLVRRS